jgi:hypothetical protein
MLRNRYAQVALTYTRPFPLRVWAVLTAAYIGWILWLREANYQVQTTMLLLGTTLAAWVGPMIAAHAKEQLADSRSRLTPGFRAPHLLVAALFFAAGVIGLAWFVVARLHQLPTVIGWPTAEASQAGLLSVVLPAAVLLALMSHTQSPVLIITILGVMGFSIFTLRPPIVRLIAGDFPVTANVIIALCLATLAGLWWRLARMHEEMFEYWRSESFNNLSIRVAMTGDRHYCRIAAAETGWLTESLRAAHRLDALANIFAAPFWARVRHWRLVIGHGQVNWISSVAIAAVFLIIHLIFNDGSKGFDMGMLIVMPAILSLTAPIMGTGFIWPQRWFMLASESLRPAQSRAAFFREQFAAMAVEVATLWFWFTLGAFLVPLILRPALVFTPSVAGALLLIAAAQVWLFGASVWLLRLRLNLFVNALAVILIVAAAGILLAVQVGEDPRAPSPLAAPVVLLIGLLVTADAYRRWLKTDLG